VQILALIWQPTHKCFLDELHELEAEAAQIFAVDLGAPVWLRILPPFLVFDDDSNFFKTLAVRSERQSTVGHSVPQVSQNVARALVGC
jgi:hypothetical protein